MILSKATRIALKVHRLSAHKCDHKTSHKINTSSESWINNISIDVCYDRTIFERVQQNLNIEKIIFKDVQIKFLAMHITNQ